MKQNKNKLTKDTHVCTDCGKGMEKNCKEYVCPKCGLTEEIIEGCN